MRFRFVSFDLNGTILRPAAAVGEIYSSAASKYGVKADPDVLEVNFNKSMKEMRVLHPNFGSHTIGWQAWWKSVVSLTFRASLENGDFERIPFEPFAEQLLTTYETKKQWTLCGGAVEILEDLRLKSVPVGAITNSDPRVDLILQDFGLKRHFLFVINSYNAYVTKPDKDIFELAERKFEKQVGRFEKKEAVHVGDSFSNDFQGARNVGWNAILVSNRRDALPEDIKNWVFTDLYEIGNYLKKLVL